MGRLVTTVTLCRVSGSGPGSTSTYNFSVGRVSNGAQSELTADDASKSFVIIFTPQAGDTPLTAEGKANIDGFVVDPANANTVTLTAHTIGFADINGCPVMPLQCVIDVKAG